VKIKELNIIVLLRMFHCFILNVEPNEEWILFDGDSHILLSHGPGLYLKASQFLGGTQPHTL
jgi:hypothetical protein